MHQSKKGKDWHFGMKAHVGADIATGLVAEPGKSWSKRYLPMNARVAESSVLLLFAPY